MCSWGFRPFPGHALHEKNLQSQKGAGPLVSSQERRARFVPRLNRGSDADPPRIQPGSNTDPTRIHRGSNAGLIPPPVYIEFRLLVILRSLSGQVCSMPWGVWRTVDPWRTDLSASRPARSRPAPPSRHAPPCPDPPVVCPGFGLDK